ncbi:MAG: transglutaminase family protein [Deltaproteobacteria bacterium]|nr:MAG: transglutaminase family protein [Deltaproteobacteria bacterium]
MDQDLSQYLVPTNIIDSDHEQVRDFARRVAAGATHPEEIAVRLYYAVRDAIRYDPYSPFYLPEHYRASFVLARRRSFCVPKASLLCALARVYGIPSRAGFATVKNHLSTKQLTEFMGSDVFVWHGFVELHLNGKWVKATPAFNRELCERHRVPPLEFNGREDSLFQPYNLENEKFMEYVEFYGIYPDIPVDAIVAGWTKAYGEDRVRTWIKTYEEKGDGIFRNFEKEEIWSG